MTHWASFSSLYCLRSLFLCMRSFQSSWEAHSLSLSLLKEHDLIHHQQHMHQRNQCLSTMQPWHLWFCHSPIVDIGTAVYVRSSFPLRLHCHNLLRQASCCKWLANQNYCSLLIRLQHELLRRHCFLGTPCRYPRLCWFLHQYHSCRVLHRDSDWLVRLHSFHFVG